MFENREACAYYKHHQVGVSCQVFIQDGIRFSVQRQVDVGDVGASRRSAVGGDFLGVKLERSLVPQSSSTLCGGLRLL